MADAMFGRVGAVGVEAASIAATGSQANGGVWLTPMYKSMDADGFNAEGASYGSDVDAAGVAFGADSVNGNMRFGAVFNIGSGDAEVVRATATASRTSSTTTALVSTQQWALVTLL